jgi:hypothetical protein
MELRNGVRGDGFRGDGFRGDEAKGMKPGGCGARAMKPGRWSQGDGARGMDPLE